jgi:protein gp37/site-specific DNA-adenine methylase
VDKPTRTKLNVFMEDQVYPTLYAKLDEFFPEFGFTRKGDKWEATLWPADFPIAVEDPRPERIQAYPNTPAIFHVHGRRSMPWTEYVNKGRPLTGVYEIACEFLAKKVGVPFPKYPITDAEREQARQWEERKHMLPYIVGICQAYLFSPAGTAAREYMTLIRGFTEDALRNLMVGLYPPPDVLWDTLIKAGLDPKIAEELRVFDESMCGYVIFPWHDAHGTLLTVYGKWPSKTLPLQKDHKGWAWKRHQALKAWQQNIDEKKTTDPWVEPEIPKTNTFAGVGTKSTPLYFDRALKAGVHQHLLAVEGVTDAATGQANGETRMVAYVAATFSEDQIKGMFRYGTKYITIVPDPDSGGEAGSLTSIKRLRQFGITSYIVQLPPGQDPDDFIIKNGIDAFRKLVENPQPGSQYEVQCLLKGVDQSSPEPARREVRDRALAFAATLTDSSEREAVIKIIASELGYGLKDLREDFTGFKKERKKQEKEQATKTGAKQGGEEDTGDYVIMDGCYARSVGNVFFPKTIFLCNCTIWISEELTETDGVEELKSFVLEGKLASGAALPPVKIRPAVFDFMSWVSGAWGSAVIVAAGMGNKDHLRAAILHHSHPVHRTVYHHTGWVKIGGEWVYLHGGGAIGAAGLVADVSVGLIEIAHYVLPEPPAGAELTAAVEKSLDLLRDLAPDSVMVPVVSSVILAPLPGAMVNINLVGKSDSFKSELAALAQQHFDPAMDALHLTALWSGTENSLEMAAFYLKDSLATYDDFVVKGSGHDIHRYHIKADRVFRGSANGGGRRRLNRNSQLMPAKPPRAMILSTAEEPFRGESLLARVLSVQIKPDDVVRNPRATECQADARKGVYAAANAGWIKWLAGKYEQIKEELAAVRLRIRDELRTDVGKRWHGRTATMVADLLAGWAVYLRFAVEVKALDQAGSERLMKRVREAILKVAGEQRSPESDPCLRFMRLLCSALSSRQAHVTNKAGDMPHPHELWGWRRDDVDSSLFKPQGQRVAWVEGDDLYLDPDAAYVVANKVGSAQGEPLEIGLESLKRDLKNGGFLASTEGERTTVRIRIAGKQTHVLHLKCNTFFDQDDDPDSSSGSSDSSNPDTPPNSNNPGDLPTDEPGQSEGILSTVSTVHPTERDPREKSFCAPEANSVLEEVCAESDSGSKDVKFLDSIFSHIHHIPEKSERDSSGTQQHDTGTQNGGGAQKISSIGSLYVGETVLTVLTPPGQLSDSDAQRAHAREAAGADPAPTGLTPEASVPTLPPVPTHTPAQPGAALAWWREYIRRWNESWWSADLAALPDAATVEREILSRLTPQELATWTAALKAGKRPVVFYDSFLLGMKPPGEPGLSDDEIVGKLNMLLVEPDDDPDDDPPQNELPIVSEVAPEPAKKKSHSVFNQTNEMVDWARWTWNPVTGCKHDCIYCYARDIANRFYAEKFEPTYHSDRLGDPANTKLPRRVATLTDPVERTAWKNVFVCSIADLFGRWVPDEWIEAVFAACRQSPQWNYLFLTKFPNRYVGLDFPPNSWVGTSVDEQKRVANAEKSFRSIKAAVKWLSVEPMREPIKFNDLSCFDWVAIGGQSRSTQAPEFFPQAEWVQDLIDQAHRAGCKVYCKPNTDPDRHWSGLYREYPAAFLADNPPSAAVVVNAPALVPALPSAPPAVKRHRKADVPWIEPKIRSPLKTFGGKGYLARRIIDLLPPHEIFIEPCAGGLSVLLNKPAAAVDIVADLNEDLTHFWTTLHDHGDEFSRRLATVPYTAEIFEHAKLCMRERSWTDDIDHALQFLIRSRMSRNGSGIDFCWSERTRGKTSPAGPQPGELNSWDTMRRDHLPRVIARLQCVTIKTASVIDTVLQYDGTDTLSYIDPPYMHGTRTTRDAYEYEMTDADHAALLDVLLSCRGAVVLSGYPSELYDTRLAGWRRIVIEMPNHAGQSKTKERRQEVLWINR